MTNPNNPFVVAFDAWRDVWNGNPQNTANSTRIAQQAADDVKRAGGTAADITGTFNQVLHAYGDALANATKNAPLSPSDVPWWVWAMIAAVVAMTYFENNGRGRRR
jgi:hypothetical protein